LQRNNFIDHFIDLLKTFGLHKIFGAGPQKYSDFCDPIGNFSISYPSQWYFDRDIIVVDGSYTISFESGKSAFVIAVDTNISNDFDFDKHVTSEFTGPKSGIRSDLKKSIFHEMRAYTREYSYVSGQMDYFGGGIIFFTENTVFSLSWNGPEKEKERLNTIFQYMVKTLSINNGDNIKKNL